jgi:hypothetical protein
MKWALLLYNVLIGVMILDAAASFLASWYIHDLRHRFGRYIALAFLGVAAEAIVSAGTMGLTPGPQKVVVSIIVVRILARIFKTITMVLLTLFLLGYINGDRRSKG